MPQGQPVVSQLLPIPTPQCVPLAPPQVPVPAPVVQPPSTSTAMIPVQPVPLALMPKGLRGSVGLQTGGIPE